MPNTLALRREEVYRLLRNDILSCALFPGQSLHEIDLAARVGVRVIRRADLPRCKRIPARRHGLHVMTRNTEHFAPTGVLLLNPWTGQEP